MPKIINSNGVQNREGSPVSLDAVDRKLLSLLSENAQMPYADLGKALHLSAPAVHARVKKLEKDGVIEGFTIRIQPDRVGKSVCAFVRLTMVGDRANSETAAYLQKFPEVEEVHGVAGEDCMIVKVRVSTPVALDTLLGKIRKAPGFQRSVTMMVLKSYFERNLSTED